MDKNAKLQLEQLHLDNKQLTLQNKSILELLEKLADKDYAKLFENAISVKQDGPIELHGELKAMFGEGGVNVLNFAELEAYFLGLQFAVVEALASPNPVTIIADDPVPVAMQRIDEVLELLSNIADKDLGVDFTGKQLNIAWPKKLAEAIPVRLVDAKGKNFYTALSTNHSGGSTIPDDLYTAGGVGTRRLKVETDTSGGPATVALDAATLAALETINAISSGTVALDAPTLAALENIIVTGTVALDAPTLAALENITAVVTGTVALDAPTLAALENITATISGAVAVTGSFDWRFGGGKLAYAAVQTASFNLTPAAGKRIKVAWVSFVPNSDNAAANLVTVKFNGAAGNLYVGYAMAHSEVFTGAVDQALSINLATAEPVAVTIHYEEI